VYTTFKAPEYKLTQEQGEINGCPRARPENARRGLSDVSNNAAIEGLGRIAWTRWGRTTDVQWKEVENRTTEEGILGAGDHRRD